MIEFLGVNDSLVLVGGDTKGAVVDTTVDLVVETGELSSLLASREWSPVAEALPNSVINLATSAIIASNVPTIVAAATRLYTIPGGVQAEAKKALKWHHEAKRGGTPVGLNTARTLAKGGQIGIEKVRHIAKYFPRHEVDKKGKGWEQGEEHFPSNGRIAWALWGGDAGWRWSQAIVERENKKALIAAGYSLEGYDEAFDEYAQPKNDFQVAHELDMNQGPEFLARVRSDATGIDRLYKIEIDGSVYVWDNCAWDDLGHVDGDIYSYDKDLDDVYDNCEKTHVVVDPSSAVIISALLNERPLGTVHLDEINEEEARLVADAIDDIDWNLVEYALAASGDKQVIEIAPIDTTGILSEHETPQTAPYIAKLATAAAILTPREIKDTLTSWAFYVIQTRKDNKNAALTSDAAPAPTGDLTPTNTDVPPKYLAIVTPTDLQAVIEVVALVPSSTTGVAPITYRRENKQWVRDDQILLDLKSATPPPVIKLDTQEMLNDVLQQADGLKNVTASALKLAPLWRKDLVSLIASLSAAGGLDRNRGNAEELRQYWTQGEGAAKIRWGQPGDWARCVRHLSKYLGVRAKGYCQLRHKEATGMYTATHAAKDKGHFSYEEFIMEEVLTKNYGVPNQITDRDLLTPLDEIIRRTDEDELCDKDWTPEPRIENMLQDEACVKAMTAAGGFDRNRGNAEELRQYWTHGKGALKIRWGTPGDWTRCVRHLAKYMGPRANGYCQLRHKEATGVYTGSKYNPGHKSNTFGDASAFDAALIEAASLVARANDARSRMSLVASADIATTEGAKFTIPLLVPEGVESGDGRKFKTNAIDIRDLPLPLLWQIQTGEGHNGSVVVGRIDTLERVPGGLGNATGVFDTGAYGQEAQRLVEGGFLRGVSADLDQFEAKEDASSENAESEDLSKKKLTINHARVMAATIVAKPAFQECSIHINDNSAL